MTPRDYHSDPDTHVILVNTTSSQHSPVLEVQDAELYLATLYLYGRWHASDHVRFMAPTYVPDDASVLVDPFNP